MHRIIAKDNGALHIIGNGHNRDLEYGMPEWAHSPDDLEQYFVYKGETYWLSEFMYPQYMPDFAGFDGYMSDSFSSGILIKWGADWSGELDSESVRVYWYYC